MASTTTWKVPLGTSPSNSGNVMKELEQKLRNRQSTEGVSERRESKTLSEKYSPEQKLKARHDTNFRLSNMSRVSPVCEWAPKVPPTSDGGVLDRRQKNELLLQARARRAAQNKEREEDPSTTITPIAFRGGGGGGGENSPLEERKDFVRSLETKSGFCIDSSSDDRTEPEGVIFRPNRAYSASFLKNNKIMPAPPRSRPPVLRETGNNRGAAAGAGGQKTPTSPNSPQLSSSPRSGGGGGQHHSIPPHGQMEKVKHSSGAKSAAVKKLFGLKKLVKGKHSKQAGGGAKQSNGGSSSPTKKVKIKKVLSENIPVHNKVSGQFDHMESEDSVPIYIPSSSNRGCQNVFDDPYFSQYAQSHESRSSTSSPTWLDPAAAAASKKKPPRPTPPRRNGTTTSTGSNESDMDVPLFSPLLVTSPSELATDGGQVVLEPPSPGVPSVSDEDSDRVSSSVPLLLGNGGMPPTRQPLAKIASFNPAGTGNGMDWMAPLTRRSTRRNKLRRAVCSDGDQDMEDLYEDYITMNSVCLEDIMRNSDPFQNVSINGLNGVGHHGALGGSQGLAPPPVSLAKSNSAHGTFSSQGLTTPSNPVSRDPPAAAVGGFLGLGVPSDPKRLSAYYLRIVGGQQAASGAPVLQGRPQIADVTSATSSSEGGGGEEVEEEEELEEEEEEEVEFYGEVSRELVVSQARATRNQSSSPLNSVPDDNDDIDNEGSDFMSVVVPPPFNTIAIAQGSKSPTPPPPRCSPLPRSNKADTKRKFQYTHVTVEASSKKRTPSVPKKFKYQTVTLGNETGKTTVAETTPNGCSEEGGATLTKVGMLSSDIERDSTPSNAMPPEPFKFEHPLINLKAGSASAVSRNERSYYINRKSLIELEACKDLPTTMLSTIDSLTGKVLWHEYVEIDEDQINKMANSFGLAKSTPIPEKLSMLLAATKQGVGAVTLTEASELEGSVQATGNQERLKATGSREKLGALAEEQLRSDTESSSDEEECANQPNSLNSSMSSECNYIFNLDDPPSVPPRPDNMDALVKQLKVRMSGDYSYAFIPQNHLFGKHWMQTNFKNARKQTMLNAAVAAIEKASSGSGSVPETSKDRILEPAAAAQQASKGPGAAKKDVATKISPPSIPPKTYSLLREQKLVSHEAPQPYLMPIIVREKLRGPPAFSRSADKVLGKEKTIIPSFVSYIKDPGTIRETPSKPVPYEMHQKRKGQQLHQYANSGMFPAQNVVSVDALPQASNSRSMAVGMKNQDTVRRKKGGANANNNNARPRGRGKGRGHKRLDRQKTQHNRGSGKIGSRRRTPPDLSRGNKGRVQKRKPNKGPRKEVIERQKRDSMAVFLQSSHEVLAEKLLSSLRLSSGEGGGGEEVATVTTATTTAATSATTAAVTAAQGTDVSCGNRSLGEILVELGHLLKSNQCSEDDLLSVVGNHLRTNLQLKRDSREALPPPPKAVPALVTEEGFVTESEGDEVWSGGEGQISESSLELVQPVQPSGNEEQAVNEEEEVVVAKSVVTVGGTAKRAPATRKGGKPSYVNLLFDSDDEVGVIETQPAEANFNQPYVNMEFLTKTTELESSKDEPDYIEPSEAIGDRMLLSLSSSNLPLKSSKFSHPHMIVTNVTSRGVDTTTDDHAGRGSTTPTPVPRPRANSSIVRSSYDREKLSVQQNQNRERTLSNPSDPDQIAPKSSSSSIEQESDFDFAVGRNSPQGRRGRSIPETPPPYKRKRGGGRKRARRSVDVLATCTGGENTSSYNLALEMEDMRFSKSMEAGTVNKTRLAMEHSKAGREPRDKRSQSSAAGIGSKGLQQINAVPLKKLQPSRSELSTTSTNGVGVFTHRGGQLTNEGSDVTVEIPENAIPRGQTQKVWFEVVQAVYNPSEEEEFIQSLSDSGSFELESLLQEKKEKRIQLSPVVIVGPSDAVLARPLVIRIPHCLPYRNNSWHLQMLGLGRGSIEVGSSAGEEGNEESWSEIANTIGHIQLPAKKNSSKFHKKSAYQMHLDYVQIKTSMLGCFKLVGRPIRNGTYAAKKMVASVYSKANPDKVSVQFDIFVNNAIHDQSSALDNSLTTHGHTPLLKSMPILCFGDGKDMEVTLSNDTNCAIPLGTKAIPFGQFWRHNKVGQSHIIFDIDTDLVEDDRTLTLKIQQAGSKLYHETNFFLSDV